MKCRECKGLFSDNFMTNGLCRACTPNTPRYNSNLTADEHDTLKAKAELLDNFIAYCSEECSVEIPLGECNIEMTFKINEIMEKYKEIK